MTDRVLRRSLGGRWEFESATSEERDRVSESGKTAEKKTLEPTGKNQTEIASLDNSAA